MAEQVVNTFGRVDILVNNAGIKVGQEGRVPIHQCRYEDWHQVVTTDLDGVILCSRAVSRQHRLHRWPSALAIPVGVRSS
jgi:NAD(P)-dependent dehydrogenase (short-subunit alcohol dehydrogenase family)